MRCRRSTASHASGETAARMAQPGVLLMMPSHRPRTPRIAGSTRTLAAGPPSNSLPRWKGRKIW
eukprot:scaffold64352_cov71-Phaeocystis_antarctica.AAC.1